VSSGFPPSKKRKKAAAPQPVINRMNTSKKVDFDLLLERPNRDMV